jgi:hypothetical protein
LGAADFLETFFRGVLFASGRFTVTPPESSTVCLFTAVAFGLRVLVLRTVGALADAVIGIDSDVYFYIIDIKKPL